MNKFTPVENILNLYDDRLWYYIPGFTGYEVSNDGYIRSMKHYRKYPFGIIIFPRKNKNGIVICPEDPTYELTTNNMERVAIKLSQLQYLARTNEYQITGYPRRTCITDTNPRNSKKFTKSKMEVKPAFDKGLFFPKFNIIHEDELQNNPMATRVLPDIVCPIETNKLEGEYYGRKDNRAFFHFNV